MQENSVEEDEINLFNPTILARLPISHVAGLLIRPLRSTDYDKGNPSDARQPYKNDKNNLL